MRPILTNKQRSFCLLIVEGETQHKAYQLAGYASKSDKVAAANASRLLENGNVQAFIAEQQALASKRTLITVESLTDDLINIRDKAIAAGSFGPAVQAVTVIARINGLMVDRAEVTVMHRPAPLPTRVLELSEADWIRQFGQGLQEKRLKQLETLDRSPQRRVNRK